MNKIETFAKNNPVKVALTGAMLFFVLLAYGVIYETYLLRSVMAFGGGTLQLFLLFIAALLIGVAEGVVIAKEDKNDR